MAAADQRVFLETPLRPRFRSLHNFHNNIYFTHFSRTIAHSSKQQPELRNADGSDTVYGFQCNERYLEWDDSAARQLIKIYVAEQLGTDLDYVNARMQELAAVCPDMVNKLDKLKANLVLTLVRDTEKVAQRMIALTNALPGINVSQMVSSNVWLLNEPSAPVLARKLEMLRLVTLFTLIFCLSGWRWHF